MGTCLKTQLKENVQNDNLDYINAFSIDITQNSQLVLLQNNTYVRHIKIVGDGHFSDSSYSAGSEKERFDNSNQTLYVATNTGCKVIFFDEYNMTQCLFNNLDAFDLNKLKYRTHLTSVNLAGTKKGNISVFKGMNLTDLIFSGVSAEVIGNLNDIKNIISLTLLTLNNTSVVGDIAVLSTLTNIRSMQIIAPLVPSGIYGLLESLLQGLWTNKTEKTGTLNFWTNGLIRFKRSTPASSTKFEATFSNGGVSVSSGGSVVATFDGTNWKDENNNVYVPD